MQRPGVWSEGLLPYPTPGVSSGLEDPLGLSSSRRLHPPPENWVADVSTAKCATSVVPVRCQDLPAK